MNSTMDHNFANVPAPQIQRSRFDLSETLKTSIDETYLYPIYHQEVLPGDTFTFQADFFARFPTLLFPVMDNMFLETFWFYCPDRLLWEHWEEFIAGGKDEPEVTPTEYEVPVVGGDPFEPISLDIYDYFGLPLGQYAAGLEPVALPMRAYNLIWSEWFRHEFLMDKPTLNTDDGPDLQTDYVLLPRTKRHDYFTSCLPWPQRGDAIALPLGTTAPVVGDGNSMGFRGRTGAGTGDAYLMLNDNTGTRNELGVSSTSGSYGAAATLDTTDTGDRYLSLAVDPAKSHVYADLTNAAAATINELRRAFALQEMLEIDARVGARYTEQIKGHFRVTVPDFRLQRPEYLGGSSKRIDIRDVPQTSESGTTKQGTLTAYAKLADSCFWSRSFVEHGQIIGLANIRADLNYQNQLHRKWSRKTRYDYYFPALAHLGEQAVLNKEVFFTPGTLPANLATNEAVFGYQERHSDQRYGTNKVTGQMRSDVSGSLAAWHLALDFASVPSLDETFMTDYPPLDRIVAVTSEPKLKLDCFYTVYATRPMPAYSVPARLGRF